MIVYIQLITAGLNVGPFDLYSDADGFVTPFETGIPRQALVDGYTSIVVPEGSTQVKVQSTGNCANSTIIDIVLEPPLTTTTTTTEASTTTTTTEAPTTTTTTTHAPGYYLYLGTISTYSNSGDACANAACSRNYYRNAPTLGDGLVLYDDEALTVPFDGGDQWIAINNEEAGCTGTWYATQVNASGVMSNTTVCPT